MMTPRFSLFFAGYSAYAPVQYYSKLSFVSNYREENDEEISKCITRITSSLEEDRAEYTSYLTSAIAIAKDFELGALPLPSSHTEYFDWLGHYTKMMEDQFPMSRIEHYYFLYARKIGEIVSNINLLKCYIDLSLDLDGKIDLTSRMEKCLRDTEYILFKLVASAALLSSEPRHNYFNLLYKELNKGFEPFKEVNVKALNNVSGKSLSEEIEKYNATVINGFKQGISLLKELQS